MGVLRKREDNWVDGLRGIAALMVVTGHLCTAYAPHYHSPAMTADGSQVLLWQRPFFRLCVGERGAVAIFFIITGFVNSLNPVKEARADNIAVSLKNLSRSTFTRSGRLVLPTSIATIVSWIFAQSGAYKLAARIDAPWISWGALFPDPLGIALDKLFRTLTLFWSTGAHAYDGVYWTLRFFLSGSFQVYLALLAMMLVTKRFWYLITLFLYIYSWCTGDFLVGINVFFGVFLAQLQTDLGPRVNSLLPRLVSSLIVVLGLYCWSFPDENHDWAGWSRSMKSFMIQIIPVNADISRYWVSVGTCITMLGILFSPDARRFLTLPFLNFLGRCSLPVYLIHNTLVRSLLVWMLYGTAAAKTPAVDAQGKMIVLQRPSIGVFLVVIPFFYVILYAAAYLWTLYIDPICARSVEKMKDLMFKNENRILLQEKTFPLTSVKSVT
ncbi:hypothetical protein VTO42DRAFT_411 [Malbranchea cinnamomea]